MYVISHLGPISYKLYALAFPSMKQRSPMVTDKKSSHNSLRSNFVKYTLLCIYNNNLLISLMWSENLSYTPKINNPCASIIKCRI